MNHGEDEDVDDFLYGDSGADKKEGPDSIDNQQESGQCSSPILRVQFKQQLTVHRLNVLFIADKGKKPDEEEEDELYGLYQGGDDNE